MSYNIGILGAGDIVRKVYLPELSKSSAFNISGICSQSGSTAQALADEYQIPTVTNNYLQLIKHGDIDCIMICTPTAMHRCMAEAAMDHNKHVLVEKPLCLNYSDSHDLLTRAQSYGRVFYPAFNNRFREENLYFRKVINEGKIGEIELIDFEWYRTRRYEQKKWLYDPQISGGGVLIDLGAHLIHMALDLIPQREEFHVFSQNYTHAPGSSQVEDTSLGMIEIDRRATIFIKTGWDMQLPSPSRVKLEVIGHEGVTSNLDYHGSKSDGYNSLLVDFFDIIEKKKNVDLQVVDDTMLIIESLYTSWKNHDIIKGKFNSLNQD